MQVSRQDPDYIAGTVFDRLVYGFHPYGKPDSGTPESLASITREDLAAFHTRWFGPNNAILAIVGDVTPEQAFAGAERAFGKWPKVEIPAARTADVPPPTRRVVVIDRPGAVQTEIRVGHVGLPRKHKDFLALDLALKILGGEGGNRLYRVLRSERGLTYGAEADVNALQEGGDIVASTDTRSDSTAEALRLIVDEFARLRRERVHPRELGDAQAYLTGSFPLTIETPGAIALQVLNAVFYGLDLDDLQTYRERVNSITPDDIQRVAQQYLAPRPAVDRAGGGRERVRQAAAGRRLRPCRTDPAERARSHGAGPACAVGVAPHARCPWRRPARPRRVWCRRRSGVPRPRGRPRRRPRSSSGPSRPRAACRSCDRSAPCAPRPRWCSPRRTARPR